MNRHAGLMFPRTQPRDWRDLPFDGERKIAGVVLKIIGIVLIWIAVLGVSLWSINESVSQQPVAKYTRAK